MSVLRSVAAAVLCGIGLSLPGILRADPAKGGDADRYLAAVRIYADTALTYGRDHYGPVPTPLFVDGIDVDTHEPVKWKSRNDHEWVLSNFASYQNLLRVLGGLTTLTGEPRYHEAAAAATRYALDHLDHGGLLSWGGHMAYNASDARMEYAEDKGPVHELKSHYPYYELLWEVDPVKTKTMMEDIWRGHILNWSILDFNRHSHPIRPGKLWDNDYSGGPVFFWGKGLTFHNAGSDLYYDAAVLAKLSGDDQPLVWSKRLAHRYVETRDPMTGLGGVQYSQEADGMCFDPEHPDACGDRAQYFYGADFPGHKVFESTLFPAYGDTPSVAERICQMSIADQLGAKGDEFSQWAVEELTAWGKVAFRKSDCSFIPMLTDGTSMEGYTVKKDGYFGPKGRVLKAGKAERRHFWAYAMAFRRSHDSFMWEMAREIALGNHLGDIGGDPANPPEKITVHDDDPTALFGFLELHRATGKSVFLDAAQQVGDGILQNRFHQGLFTLAGRRFASFRSSEPLALLHLAAAKMGREDAVPYYPAAEGFFQADYSNMGNMGDDFLFNLRRRKPGTELTVTDLQAVARDGQIFLIWKEADTAAGTSFNVYVADRPIADLAKARRIGHHIERRSGRDWWTDPASFTKGATIAEPVGFRLDNHSPRLSPLGGLFVHTVAPDEKSALFFAVTTTDADGHEQTALTAGANSLAQGVIPVPGPIKPIWQREGQPPASGMGKGLPLWLDLHAKSGVVADMEYLAFGDATMGWREGLPFKFSVRVEKDSVVVRPTDRVWINRPHDEARDAGAPAIWTFWYGYNSKIYDRSLMGSGVPTNYTELRNLWILNWVRDQYQPDPNRWTCSGSSMGGCGTMSFGLRHPELFAACHAMVPIVAYTDLGEENGHRLGPSSASRLEPSCWTGPIPADLKTNEGVPLLERMNSTKFVTESDAELPYLFIINGRQDGSIPWQNNPPFYRAMEKARRGFSAFWDNGTHSDCGKNAPADVKAWTTRFKQRFRRDESYPSFSHTSTDRNPGNGSPGDGDIIGWINRGVDWKEVEDTPDHYALIILADAVESSYPVSTEITLHRVRQFRTQPGEKLSVRIGDAAPTTVSTDHQGRITIPKVLIPSTNGVHIRIDRP
jgi:pectate lyase